MTRYSRKKGNNAPYSKIGKRIKTKNREKDLDEVHEDIKNEAKGLKRERDIDLPGEGQFVCVQCRYFIYLPNYICVYLCICIFQPIFY